MSSSNEVVSDPRDLLTTWRNSANFLEGLPATKDLASARQDVIRFRRCADELEAALASPSVPQPATECLECLRLRAVIRAMTEHGYGPPSGLDKPRGV